MTNQKPALLVQRAPWTRAVMMLLQSLYFSLFLPNRPRPLSSFDTHARWQPVTQSARSRRSYGKIEDCEQSIESLFKQNYDSYKKTRAEMNMNRFAEIFRLN